jgi:hypothetical protein
VSVRKIVRLHGPYVSQTDKARPRKFVIRRYEDGSRETTSYARHLMEMYLGRELGPDEEVDHKDDDQTNDSLDNLVVLPLRENRAKGRSVEMVTIVCIRCGESAEKRARDVRSNRKQGKAGPYCSKRCAGKMHH